MDDAVKKEVAEWLSQRPEKVQKLAAEFPLGLKIADGDGVLYVIGWTEDDSLIVSETPPDEMYASREAYEKVMAERQYIHAEHLRNGEVKHE